MNAEDQLFAFTALGRCDGHQQEVGRTQQNPPIWTDRASPNHTFAAAPITSIATVRLTSAHVQEEYMKRHGTTSTETDRRKQRRALSGIAVVGLLGVGGVIGTALPSQAAVTTICTGAGFKCDTTGYGKVAKKSYWTMASGHNCTNYVAYRLIQAGMPKNITWLHNGGDWAREARKHHVPVDQVPTVGSVAQWNNGAGGLSSSGHVAFVIEVTPTSITVAEDNYSAGPMDIRAITKGDPGWPSNFIHFTPANMGAPAPAAPTPAQAGEWQMFVANYERTYPQLPTRFQG